MIDLLVLIIFTTIFAYVIQCRTYMYDSAREGIREDIQSKIVFIGIFVAFILFAGLRSKYNDTTTYMQGFKLINVNNLKLSTLLEPYGGFKLYQQVLKKHISDNPQIFIFVSAIITNVLYLVFYTRHTNRYSGMIFLYGIGNYLGSMAGLKQSIAVGISLYAIEAYLEKKYIKGILLILFAMTFHPYIVCLLCIPFLKNRICDGKTVFVIILCVLAFMNMDKVFVIFNIIGQDYSNEIFDNYTINPIRVLVEAVPVMICYVYKRELNESDNKLLILGMNMRIISFVFIAMGLFVNPIYFGRMSSYFTGLSTIAIPEMLNLIWKENRNRKVYIMGYYIFFLAYFLMDMTKIGSISIFYDQFNHIPLNSLFMRKGLMH